MMKISNKTMRVTFEPTDKEIEAVLTGLIKYNRQYLTPNDHTKFAVFHEVEGKILGGLTGDILGHWLRINYLWVDDSLRGQNIGSQLIQQAEDSAREYGAKFAQVDTFSFQARPFYLGLGYQEIFTLQEYPRIHERHYFQKAL